MIEVNPGTANTHSINKQEENTTHSNIDLSNSDGSEQTKNPQSHKEKFSPVTPSKKRKVSSTAIEIYDNVQCVRRGENGCLYFVHEKKTKRELCVKEVSSQQALKEFEFSKKLSSSYNPNVMTYNFVPPNLLESVWFQNGSYDQYARQILFGSPPNSISMLSHFRDLVSGVAHIELLGFVHLDLKPANIFVGSPVHDMIPSLLIGDFGSMVPVGTLLDDDQEGDGKYIAPEVFQPNYKASTKHDVYSLALSLIEISTAEAMTNEKWNEFRVRKQDMELRQPSNLSEDLFSFIPKMLSLNPLCRPDASAMLPIIQHCFDIGNMDEESSPRKMDDETSTMQIEENCHYITEHAELGINCK